MFAHCNIIELDTEASQFVEGKVKDKKVGKPILPSTFGESSYYGLYDIGTVVNVIPSGFYLDIQDEVEPAKLLNTDMPIMLADKTLRVPMGVIRDVRISIGPYTYTIEFVVVDMPTNSYCPIIFGRTFLNTTGQTLIARRQLLSSSGKLKSNSTSQNLNTSPPMKSLKSKTRKKVTLLLALLPYFMKHLMMI
jgi:hypothetical protein